jgi:outer membrane murein-binding lipoprotein Lpp
MFLVSTEYVGVPPPVTQAGSSSSGDVRGVRGKGKVTRTVENTESRLAAARDELARAEERHDILSEQVAELRSRVRRLEGGR